MAVRNTFYNEEIYNNEVNKESKEVLDDYTLELQSKNKSKGTIKQYVADIKMFLCWANDNLSNKYILDMKKRDFRNFFLALSNSGKSSARINRVQCSLRNLLEFCYQDDDMYEDYNRNVMASIKGLEKQDVRDIVFLDDEQITFLIDYYMDKEEYQKALYISLAYDSAGRRNEIYQVEKHNIAESRLTNYVVGKRGKKFQLFYLDRTQEIAKKYLEQRGEDDIDSLWTKQTLDGKASIESNTLYKWTLSMRAVLKEEYGEDVLLNAHSFRHSALENYENGTHHSLKYLGKENLDIKHLKTLANHSDTSTTESYLKNKDDEELKEIFGI